MASDDSRAGRRESRRLDRRELIESALKFGGVAYVAPMILASVTPAAAQVTTACQGRVCGTYVACNNNNGCACALLHTGQGFCTFDELCSNLQNCGSGNSCPTGSICALSTCCTPANKCIPLALACIDSGTVRELGPGATLFGRN